MRICLVAGIAVCLIFNLCPHPFASLGNLWSSEAIDTVPVLVADHFVPAFQVIKPENVRIRQYPKDFVPPGALHTKAELQIDAGRYAYSSVVSIPEGEALTRTVLSEVSKNHGLSSLLRFGKVAVSLKVDKSRAAGGWIQPGDTVALFGTTPLDPRSAVAIRKRTSLLLSAVKVLAVDQVHVGQEPDPAEKTDGIAALTAVESDSHMITILVNPIEAGAVIEARERGPLSVVLRSPGDDLPWTTAE